jgi:hypothetical protein
MNDAALVGCNVQPLAGSYRAPDLANDGDIDALAILDMPKSGLPLQCPDVDPDIVRIHEANGHQVTVRARGCVRRVCKELVHGARVDGGQPLA